jgi:hypothetical protein
MQNIPSDAGTGLHDRLLSAHEASLKGPQGVKVSIDYISVDDLEKIILGMIDFKQLGFDRGLLLYTLLNAVKAYIADHEGP